MARSIEQRYTIRDLYDVPEDGNRYELSRGCLIAEPPAGGGHGRVATRFARRLDAYAERTGRGVVLICDAGFVLARHPDTVRAPDVAWVDIDRYRALGDDSGLLPLAPDLAVEVRSPGDRRGAIERKLEDWFDAGTREVWLADPVRRNVIVFTADAAPQTLEGTQTLRSPQLLPGFEAPLADLFRSPFDPA